MPFRFKLRFEIAIVDFGSELFQLTRNLRKLLTQSVHVVQTANITSIALGFTPRQPFRLQLGHQLDFLHDIGTSLILLLNVSLSDTPKERLVEHVGVAMHEKRLIRTRGGKRGEGGSRPHALQRFHPDAQRREDGLWQRLTKREINRRSRRRNPRSSPICTQRPKIGTVSGIGMTTMQTSDDVHLILVRLQRLHGLFKGHPIKRTAFIQPFGNAG